MLLKYKINWHIYLWTYCFTRFINTIQKLGHILKSKPLRFVKIVSPSASSTAWFHLLWKFSIRLSFFFFKAEMEHFLLKLVSILFQASCTKFLFLWSGRLGFQITGYLSNSSKNSIMRSLDHSILNYNTTRTWMAKDLPASATNKTLLIKSEASQHASWERYYEFKQV